MSQYSVTPNDKELEHRMKTQSREFDAVNELSKAYRNLPAIVDDDYPKMRYYYESAVRTLIDAMKENGRLQK